MKAYNVNRIRDDNVIENDFMKEKAATLETGMKKKIIKAIMVGQNYDRLRPLINEEINAEERKEKVKQHLQIVKKQWTN